MSSQASTQAGGSQIKPLSTVSLSLFLCLPLSHTHAKSTHTHTSTQSCTGAYVNMCVGYAHKSIKSIEAPPLFEHRQKGDMRGTQRRQIDGKRGRRLLMGAGD